MDRTLNGKRIAILATNGVEESELVEPRTALDNAGAKTELISPAFGKTQAMRHKQQGNTFDVDLAMDDANADDYDALLLPGGVANPDELRTEPRAVKLREGDFRAGKTHRLDLPWTVDAGRSGRRLRSYSDVVAVAENRPQQRRSNLDRSRSGAGWTVNDQAANLTTCQHSLAKCFGRFLQVLKHRTLAHDHRRSGLKRTRKEDLPGGRFHPCLSVQ
jgi:protease I